MINVDYLYNPEKAKSYFENNSIIDKKLGFQIVEHGTILPHIINENNRPFGMCGILNEENDFVSNTFIFKGKMNYPPPTESIQHRSETVIYLGLFLYVWGHSISNALERVWFLNSESFKKLFKDCPIVYIEWREANLKNHKSFCRLLEILEIDVDRLQPIKQPTQFDKIVVPDGSWNEGITNVYFETIDRLKSFALKNRTPTPYKKIYYFHGRRFQVGEEHLAEYIKSKGYEIVRPEKLTFDEQLNLMINAEHFVSTIGSCSHNSIFMRDNMQAIFIPRAPETHRTRAYASYLNNVQKAFNQHNNLNAIYIDSTLSIFDNPCYVISKQLKSFFGDKWNGYEEEDFKAFLSYVKFNLNKGMVIKPEYLGAYRRVSPDFIEQLEQREDLIKVYDMPKDWERLKLILLNSVIYQTHVHKKGWCPWIRENQISNPIGDKFNVQAIKIDFPGHKVYYSVYYNNEEGWSQEVTAGQMVGTTDKSKPIYGMRVRLDEADSKEFDILYRIHKFDGTWTPWAKNGEVLYSYGQLLNAIQVKLEPVKPAEDTKELDYTQILLLKDDEIYSQGQRQNLIQ